MHKLKLLFLLCFFTLNVFCQENIDTQKWKNDFTNSTNDSVFITKYGSKPFAVTLIKKSSDNLYPTQDENIFKAKEGTVFGPYDFGKNWKFIKIIGFINRYKMNASHILIHSDKYNEKINKHGEAMVKKLLKGQDFAKSAAMNSDDAATRPSGGDLGWFYEGEMVPEFDKAVLQHHIGDIFMVWTEFGLHIIKINQEKRKDKYEVKVVEFYKAKN